MSTHLSLDIQEEIIFRLPVESLIRFRSVCKAWKSLIDCSEFIVAYSVRHTQPQHFLIRYEVGDREENEVKCVSYVDDDSFPQQKFSLTVPSLVQLTKTKPKTIGSSHGLLCLTTWRTRMAVLWNPSIRKAIVVDVPYMVHWPFKSVIGFGVCPYTNDPKLVNIIYIGAPRNIERISCIPCQVLVFTLSSGEWKTPCSNVPSRSVEFTGSQTVIGRFIYWHAFDWIDYDWIDEDDNPRNLIMSFDMSSEEFREIDLPDSLAYVPLTYMDLSVSRLRESLVLLVYNRETINKQVCDVWMMDHGDSKAFTKLFTINPPNASVSRTLGFRNTGEPIVEMVSDNKDICTLVVYEPCLEHIKDLGICGNRFSFFGSSYTESLLLLDHEDGHIVTCEAL